MVSSGSTGAGVKVSKLHDRKKTVAEKYPQTKKQISKMHKQINKFEEENPEEKKRINKIRRQLEKLQGKLQEDDSDEEVLPEIDQSSPSPKKNGKTVSPIIRRPYGYVGMRVFGRRSAGSNQDFKQSAKVAIGYYNKTSPIRYYVVEVIKAARHLRLGYVIWLTFTAAPPEDDEKVETFEAEIYYTIGQTKVNYVQMVGSGPPIDESMFRRQRLCGEA